MTANEPSDYYVCDYCGHVEARPVCDDRPQSGARCEFCRKRLDLRVLFATLDDAERYSQTFLDYHRT